eukprot:Skav201346  [mRNA]  locus=scaffold1389:478052:481319:+ [translate_table: standard]
MAALQTKKEFGAPLLMEDLAFLLSLPEGRDLLNAIGRQDWSAILSHPEWTAALQTRCALCGMHQARPQSMNSHMRQQHGSFMGDVISKAAQLVKAFEPGPACGRCQKPFKQTHQCHVWTQLAVLLLHLPAEFKPHPGPKDELILRCEVCRLKCTDRAHLCSHLQSHRLVVQDWHAARDSLGGSSTCRHCSKHFEKMNGLMQHIILGKCRQFRADADHVTKPLNEQIMQMFTTGTYLDLPQIIHDHDPSHQCLCCDSRFDRPQHLANHLQQQHGDLWFRAQPLTKFLSVCTLDTAGCLCTPPIPDPRGDHLCLPLQQVAMLFERSALPFWIPFPMNYELCVDRLHSQLDETTQHQLLATLHPGTVDLLWKDVPMAHVLSTQCVFCGLHAPPADLATHVLAVHGSTTPLSTMLRDLLIPCFIRQVVHDHQCCACRLPFQTDDPDAQPHHVAHMHFQKQCPVIAQVACLIVQSNELAHGVEPGRDGSASADLPRPVTDVPVGGHAGHKRPGQQTTEAPSGCRPRRTSRSRSPECPAVGGPIGSETRGRAESDAPSGQWPGGTDLHTGQAADLASRPHMALPEMGCGPEKTCGQPSQEAADHGCDEGQTGGGSGEAVYPRLSPEVSFIADSASEPDHSMEAAATQLCGRPHLAPERIRDECSVVPDCVPVQATQPAEIPLDPTGGPSSPPPQGEGQGEEEDFGEGRSLIHLEHGDSERQSLMHQLMHNCLVNASHWCYASSGFVSTMWALLSCRDFDCQQLTIGDEPLRHTIRDAARHPLSLADQPWFLSMMVQWTGGDGEADTAEFIHLLLRSLRLADLDFGWKKIIDVEGAPPELFDHGGPLQPILMQLPAHVPQELTLTDLIDLWAGANGMRTALKYKAKHVCLQLDRMVMNTLGEVIKHHSRIQYDGPVELPVWDDAHTITKYQYDVMAATVHRGCADRGHYVSMIRLGADCTHEEFPRHTEAQWLLIDDGALTRLIKGWPAWIAAKVNLVWLTLQEVVSVPAPPPMVQMAPESDRDRLFSLLM